MSMLKRSSGEFQSRMLSWIVIARLFWLGVMTGLFSKALPAQAVDLSFTCRTVTTELGNENVLTVAQTSRGEIPLIYWLSEYISPSEGGLQSQCEAATHVLQQQLTHGQPGFIRTAVIDETSVLCVSADRRDRCQESAIIATLVSTADRYQALIDLLNLRQVSAESRLYFTDDLVTYVDREAVVNLDTLFEVSSENTSSDSSTFPEGEDDDSN